MRKVLMLLLVSGYIYTLTLDVFMTSFFRIPSPLLLAVPLIYFFRDKGSDIMFKSELVLMLAAIAFYYILAQRDFLGFFNSGTTVLGCGLYFSLYIGSNRQRFSYSIVIFFTVLLLSMIVLMIDHYSPEIGYSIRSFALDEQVKQSPSGLALTQFTFGYQLTAFTVLIFGVCMIFRVNFLLIVIALLFSSVCIYLGMNRSALLSFGFSAVFLLLIKFKYKVLPIVLIILITIALVPKDIISSTNSEQDRNNILAKNNAKEANEFNRLELSAENLAIYADYPLGLIFYGKKWEDVIYRNPAFPNGISSHNAYLMFVTYLGPFVSLVVFLGLYRKPLHIARRAILDANTRTSWVLPLFIAFLSVSINACSHNAWLISANGPTVFLYFALLQGANIYYESHS